MKRINISNKRTTKIRLNIMLVLAILNLLCFMYLTKLFSNFDLFSSLLFLAVNVLLIILVLRIEYFEYDNSGEVISIRSMHPLFKNAEKRTEFPKNKLYDFWITRNFMGTIHLKFGIENYNSKKIVVHHKLYCCDKDIMRKMQASFVQLKKLNLLSPNN